MIKVENINFETKEKMYNYMNMKLTGMICEENDWLASLANTSALINTILTDINWIGFYIYKNNQLILGPFQGKPACTHIAIGSGVCGTAAQTLKTQLVENVHEFTGHIACDSESNSEIVVPIIQNNKLVAVLDIDSPVLCRFDEEDKKYLEKFVNIIIKFIKFPDLYNNQNK